MLNLFSCLVSLLVKLHLLDRQSRLASFEIGLVKIVGRGLRVVVEALQFNFAA
jgi:hypothetical protein